jgi:hypothetical protein
MFTENDLAQIKNRGMSVETVEQQIEHFEQGFPFLEVVKAATTKDGIMEFDQNVIDQYIHSYEEKSKHKKVVKFVPASGAASRMFKDLFSFMESYQGREEDYQKLINDEKKQPVFDFFKHISNFAFYDDLKSTYEKTYGIGLHEAILQRKYTSVLEALLTEKGLNYGNLPKGLLKFHSYKDGAARTPVEEHLVEGAAYCRDNAGNVYLHFTVSPEHKDRFEALVKEVKEVYEQRFGVTYHVSYSEQKPSTDTIAVDLDNQPFREEDGTILFRPGGHGALINNLNDLDADIVFIKNIDNVVPDHLKEETFRYKKALGGILLHYQERIFTYLKELEEGDNVNDEFLEQVREFLENALFTVSSEVFSAMDGEEKMTYLIEKLDRPMRVCGMVKNEGEPGGGPFWATNADSSSLQIVEQAQIDMENPEQAEIARNATHFNPVDIVCSLKDHHGKKYDLKRYVDPQTGFISKKSKDGRELKALELPGLWNGAMSDWNTIFVEVPIITFNPVKTVNDLLRPQHQKQ